MSNTPYSNNLVPFVNMTADILKYKRKGLSYENFFHLMYERGLSTSAGIITGTLFSINDGYSSLVNNTPINEGSAWVVSGVGIAYVAQLLAEKTKPLQIKRFQRKMSKMYGIELKIDDFHNSSVSSLHLQAHLANKIMSTLPFIGLKNWKEATNKMIGFAVKNYKKFEKFLNKDIKKVLKKEQIKEEDIDNFTEEYEKNKPKDIQALISNSYYFKDIKNKNIKNYLSQKSKSEIGSNEGNNLEMNNDLKLKELNTIAINRAYHKTLVQSVELSFTRLLKIYAQQYVSQLEYDTYKNIKEPSKKLKKLDKHLKEFANLYEYTVEASSDEKINEYKIFKNFYNQSIKDKENPQNNENNSFTKHNVKLMKEISEEGFEKTLKRINPELSDGKTVNIITFVDAFNYYKDSLIESEEIHSNKIKRTKTTVDYSEIKETFAETFKNKTTEGKVTLNKIKNNSNKNINSNLS